MHQSLVNNLNHWFLNKICQDGFDLQNTLVRKDNLDREALEGILGSFRGLINLWFIFVNFQQILLSVRLTFSPNQTR
jgi:hypothetical protein